MARDISITKVLRVLAKIKGRKVMNNKQLPYGHFKELVLELIDCCLSEEEKQIVLKKLETRW